MRFVKFLAIATTVVAMASCGVIGGSSANSTSSVATTNGQACGAALKNLYTQYKSDGSLDLKNISNVVNLATLANGVEGLKGQDDKSTFYKEFAAGLVLGSNNLVSQSNSTNVTSSLASLAGLDLSSLTSAATSALTKSNSTSSAAKSETTRSTSDALSSLANNKDVNTAVNTVTSILGLLGK